MNQPIDTAGGKFFHELPQPSFTPQFDLLRQATEDEARNNAPRFTAMADTMRDYRDWLRNKDAELASHTRMLVDTWRGNAMTAVNDQFRSNTVAMRDMVQLHEAANFEGLLRDLSSQLVQVQSAVAGLDEERRAALEKINNARPAPTDPKPAYADLDRQLVEQVTSQHTNQLVQNYVVLNARLKSLSNTPWQWQHGREAPKPPGAPGLAGKPPGAAGKPPGAAGKPPGAAGKPPGSTGKPPGSTGKPPGSTGKPPGSTGSLASAGGSPASSGSLTGSGAAGLTGLPSTNPQLAGAPTTLPDGTGLGSQSPGSTPILPSSGTPTRTLPISTLPFSPGVSRPPSFADLIRSVKPAVTGLPGSRSGSSSVTGPSSLTGPGGTTGSGGATASPVLAGPGGATGLPGTANAGNAGGRGGVPFYPPPMGGMGGGRGGGGAVKAGTSDRPGGPGLDGAGVPAEPQNAGVPTRLRGRAGQDVRRGRAGRPARRGRRAGQGPQNDGRDVLDEHLWRVEPPEMSDP